MSSLKGTNDDPYQEAVEAKAKKFFGLRGGGGSSQNITPNESS
jgi:hypothetical protein